MVGLVNEKNRNAILQRTNEETALEMIKLKDYDKEIFKLKELNAQSKREKLAIELVCLKIKIFVHLFFFFENRELKFFSTHKKSIEIFFFLGKKASRKSMSQSI